MLFVEEFSFAIEAAGLPRHQREEFLINSLPISVRNVIQTTFNAFENRTWDALVKEITNYALDLDCAADKNFTTLNIFTFRSEEN